jgi:hypothetical protein
LAAAPALAYHSFSAEFDANTPVKIEDTVKEFRWVTPAPDERPER